MKVEQRLAEIVSERCINMKALAAKADINYQTLCRCLRGEQELKADEFLAICRIADVDPREFIAA